MFALPENAKPYTNCFIVTVTPAMAKEWLKHNSFNRPLKPRLVDKYVRQILAGHWQRTHQGIAFNAEGIIIDGQHRLTAIIKTGQSVPMLVFLNENKLAHESIDNGKTRSLLDVVRLELNDNTIKSKHISALKAMWAGRFCKNQDDLTAVEISNMIRRYNGALRFAVDMTDIPGVNDAVVMGVLARAYLTVPAEQLLEFCRILRGYDSEHPTASLIREYRTWLLTLRDRQEATRRDVYKRTQAILAAFLKNETTCDMFRDQTEMFPIHGNRTVQ
ncbi:MAG TPA: hypothetical protein DEB39_10360 [Planctomycetaceae bacterium]|nr:hypothetical protein [Planctomycetaceae bacterium]